MAVEDPYAGRVGRVAQDQVAVRRNDNRVSSHGVCPIERRGVPREIVLPKAEDLESVTVEVERVITVV